MKKAISIPVHSKGLIYQSLIDSSDYDLVSLYYWTLHKEGYAVAYDPETKRNILMHRLIMRLTDSQSICDHINHNPRDNRRENLRICNRSENRRNSLKSPGLTSKYKGVYLDRGYWHSQITIGKITRNLGNYHCEATAARAYDQQAYSLFGSFACINFNEGLPVQTCIQFNYE